MILSQNKIFLTKNVLNKLENIQNNNQNITFIKSKKDLPIPFYKNKLLHSKYNPLRTPANIDTNQHDKFIAALGLYGSYHLVELSKNNYVAVIPLDYELLLSVLSVIDLSIYFHKNNFVIAEIEALQDLYKKSGCKEYSIVTYNVLEEYQNKQILNYIRNIKESLNNLITDDRTIKHFAYLWFKNFIKNLKLINEGFYKLKKFTIEKPVLITGAGPSLEHNIEVIKKYNNYLTIISTDTSLNILLSHNIIPDYVFTTDPNPYSYLHFTGFNNNTKIINDITSSIHIPQAAQMTLLTSHPFCSFLNNYPNNLFKIKTDSGNIGGIIMEFIRKYFDNIPIVTVGIDYAAYNFTLYSKYSYLDSYKLIYSDYFDSPNDTDVNLFYKKSYIKNIDNWKINSLFDYYKTNSICENIHTLSASPNIRQNRINENDLQKIVNKKYKKTEYEINYPQLNKAYQNDLSLFLAELNARYPQVISKNILMRFPHL